MLVQDSDNHTFGCPIYTLQYALQGGSAILKWNPYCQLGINLGPSPFHTCNMYLVLNPSTELVSLQFHVSFDDFFVTISYDSYVMDAPTKWQQLAGQMQFLDIEPDTMNKTMAVQAVPSKMTLLSSIWYSPLKNMREGVNCWLQSLNFASRTSYCWISARTSRFRACPSIWNKFKRKAA